MKSFHDRFFLSLTSNPGRLNPYGIWDEESFSATQLKNHFWRIQMIGNAHEIRVCSDSRIFVCFENSTLCPPQRYQMWKWLIQFELWMFLAMFGHGLEASICIPLCLWNAMHFCPYRQDKSEILFTFRQFASQHVPSFRWKLALKFGSNKTFLIIFKR